LRVAAYDPFLAGDPGACEAGGAVACASLEELLASADFVTLHLPLTPDTAKLIDARRLALMKPGAFLINTSRGGIVDEVALEAALRGTRLAGAALDVRETEPPGAPGGLESLPNVILTPHIGAFTQEAQTRP
jgi:(S)-sulfolactate dehydrogenase